MANFFDQFDQPQAATPQDGNFFDQFDDPAQPSGSGLPRVYITGKPDQPAPTPAEAPSFTDTVGDIAKSAGIGVVKGAVGLAGMPGDLAELGARGLDYATRGVGSLFGADISPRPEQDPFLGSGQIRNAIEGATGKFYEPKTTAGGYAQSLGEFLPNLIGGPETLAAKMLTRVAAPAIASESAGQLTKGTPLEPVARFGGAVLGGAGAAKLAAPAAVAAPSATQIKGTARLAYKHPEVKALEIDPASTSRAADTITSHLNGEGFRDITAPTTYRLVQELKSPVGPTAKIEDVTAVKTALNRLASTPGPEGAAAKTAISQIDGYLANLQQPDLIAGDATRATNILKRASSDWRSFKQLEAVNEAAAKAERQASRAHSGGNIDNATRQKFSAILDNQKRAKFFTAEEREQMQKIVDGTFTGNALRRVGKLLGGGGGLGAYVTGAGGYAAGGLPGLALPLVGVGAKKLGDMSTARAVDELQRLIAMNSSVGKALPAQLPATNPAIAGLLAGLTQHRAQ